MIDSDISPIDVVEVIPKSPHQVLFGDRCRHVRRQRFAETFSPMCAEPRAIVRMCKRGDNSC
jgi:hypothetical protein